MFKTMLRWLLKHVDLNDILTLVTPYLLAWAQNRAALLGKSLKDMAATFRPHIIASVDQRIATFSATDAGKATTLDEDADAAWHILMADDDRMTRLHGLLVQIGNKAELITGQTAHEIMALCDDGEEILSGRKI